MYAHETKYYRAHDSAENGVLSKKIVMSLEPVRNDRSFKLRQILHEECSYFGMKKKESGIQRESISTNPATIFKDLHHA